MISRNENKIALTSVFVLGIQIYTILENKPIKYNYIKRSLSTKNNVNTNVKDRKNTIELFLGHILNNYNTRQLRNPAKVRENFASRKTNNKFPFGTKMGTVYT